MKELKCPQCGGVMKESTERHADILLIILGLVLTPIIIGIPLLILGLIGPRSFFWVCQNCGYHFEKKVIGGNEREASEFSKFNESWVKEHFRNIKRREREK